jgi:hypothetical protein
VSTSVLDTFPKRVTGWIASKTQEVIFFFQNKKILTSFNNNLVGYCTFGCSVKKKSTFKIYSTKILLFFRIADKVITFQ